MSTTSSMATRKVSLDDRYTVEQGQVLLTGIQALVRLPIDQMRLDRSNGLNTGTFISGYRGSPLGGYDLQLMRAEKLLDQYNIRFQPGVNEELGATAVWGSQQVNLFEKANVDGVCGIWYGKTPGVDRSTDAFRHANAAGTSEHGGVLVIAGDDHGCKSSTYPGQSEFAFVDMHMPVLNPCSVQEVLDYGLYGIALSRFSGCWVAMIALTENMDSAATVNVAPDRVSIHKPEDVDIPEGGLGIRLQDTPVAQEERLWKYKRPAAIAFCRANNLNPVILENPDAKLGIVTTGKAHGDLMQALDEMGIDAEEAKALGIRILKVGMTYPLDVESIRDFARGLDYLFVVEEKRSLIEVQLKEELYNVEVVDPNFPRIIGKTNEFDQPLLPIYGELSPAVIAEVLSKLLPDDYQSPVIHQRLTAIAESQKCVKGFTALQTQRTPFYCSGCPHNTSTKVPEGSRAMVGIGCHYMVQWMDRESYTFSQMGGEGVGWIGIAPFTDTPHVFANLGDGTYFHSGILAVRAAIASKVNITYKLLYNNAVAMTGGQPHDGELTPDKIALQLLAEGVSKLVLVMDDPKKYQGKLSFPSEVEIHHRDELSTIQKQLREIKGTTVILYDQTCATELRRQRKRGLVEDPARRVVINEEVCEGCGDCSLESNCISVEPLQTALGVKRQINQTTCNKDLSCVSGHCPALVTIEGGALRKPHASSVDFLGYAESLPAPDVPSLEQPWNILVTGIGGTGVVTVGAVLAMAAHIEGKAATTLDQTGLAQKGGAVFSHIRFAAREEQLHAVRISDANADALIACDLVAAGNRDATLAKLNPKKSHAVVNSDIAPTSAFVMTQTVTDEKSLMLEQLTNCSREVDTVNGTSLTQEALGGTTTSNLFMVGYAFQKGLIPLDFEALLKAIELNGVAVEANQKTVIAGRMAAHDLANLNRLLGIGAVTIEMPPTLDEIVEDRVQRLTDYQDDALAARYSKMLSTIKALETEISPGSKKLTRAVAQSYYQVLAYKDEYEVARLHTSKTFKKRLEETFEGDFKVHFHFAPPLFSRIDPETGRANKRRFGPWVETLLQRLANLKQIRNRWYDPFRFTKDRQDEIALLEQFESDLEVIKGKLTKATLASACELASLPQQVRGYGIVKHQAIEKQNQQREVLLKQLQYASESTTADPAVMIQEVSNMARSA